MTNTEIVEKFYYHLSRQEYEQVANLYHEEVVFDNEALGKFYGKDVKKLMYMMVDKGVFMSKVEFNNITAFGDIVSVVLNIQIENKNYPDKIIKRQSIANFKIKDKKIISQLESFDLNNWAIQAFGWKGLLVGKTLLGKKILHQKIKSELKKYELK